MLSSAFCPASTACDNVCGTCTYTRNGLVCARRNNARPLPAVMSWPTSVSRAVIVPANGAVTREAFQVLQPVQIRACCLEVRFFQFVISLLLSGFLFAHARGLQ